MHKKTPQNQGNTQGSNNNIRFFRTSWAICLAFVTIGSLLPGSPDSPPIWGSDKLLHLISYLGLALLQTFIIQDKRHLFRFALGLAIWGVLIEAAQSLVPYRCPSFWDFVANSAGVGLGTLLGLKLRSRFLKHFSAR